MAAEEGSVAMSEIVVDDEGQTLDYVGLRRVYAFETTAPAQNQLIFDGYIADKTVGRLPTEGQDDDPSVTGRRWTLQLTDVNSVLSRRIITGADGNRPAETDVARINWLLSANDKYLSNTHDSWDYPSAYVSSASPVNMDAADLRGQTAFDVLNDCAQASGKNWFVRYNEQNDTYPPTNGGGLQLWYDFDSSTAFRSTTRLTNVQADVDNTTTFAVFPDAQLSRDANRVYSGIYATYDGGSLYQQSTNVADLFQQRDAAVSMLNVKTSSAASARITRYLADATTEDDRITCSYLVPKQYVNSIREGQSFQAKFTHLPNWGSQYNYMRVLRRTVTAYPGEQFYLIRLELSPITTPHQISLVQQASQYMGIAGTVTLPSAPVAGNILVMAAGCRSNSSVNDPFQNSAVGPLLPFTDFVAQVKQKAGSTDRIRMAYRVSDGTEQVMWFNQNEVYAQIWELSGLTSTQCAAAATLRLDSQASAGTKSLGTLTSATGHFAFTTFIWDQDLDGNHYHSPSAGWTEDYEDGFDDGVLHDGHPWMEINHNFTPSGNLTASTVGNAFQWGGIAVDLAPA
jgi:hypothetical protein